MTASVTQLTRCRECGKLKPWPKGFTVNRLGSSPRANKRLCSECSILRKEDRRLEWST